MSCLNPLHWKINVSVRGTGNPFDFLNESNLIEGIDNIERLEKQKGGRVF